MNGNAAFKDIFLFRQRQITQPAAKQLLMQQQVNSTFNNLLRYLSKNIGRKEGGQKINAASE